MLQRLLLLLALLFVPTLAEARGIEPELLAEGPAPPGGEVELAIHMRTNPGWHGYWLNPGDAGLPMQVNWQLPPGFEIGELRYPVPTRLTIGSLMNFVYKGDYAVLVRLRVPPAARGTAAIRANANWLACTDKVCVPESGNFAIDLPVGIGEPVERQRFDAWRRALPQPLTTAATFDAAPGILRFAFPLPANIHVDDPYVFPATDGVFEYAGEQTFRRSGNRLIAEVPLRGEPQQQIAGVLALGDGRGLAFEAVAGPVPEGGRPLRDLGTAAILWAVLGAIVGGILLNLMPCVFPILALKAMHLAKSGGDERHSRRDALSYGAGAIIGTGALGAALLALRAGGTAAGWAFQLQDPRTILFLMLLATAITLNLLGLFRLPVIAGGARPHGSFATGALAAFVATPCAGPFLGAALGTALLLPPAGSVLVFAALGFGLALPFIVIGFVPRLRRMLPKPGEWMVRLQRYLAIPMAATAVGCLWLLYRQTGEQGLVLGLLSATLLTFLLAGYSHFQRRGVGTGWAVTGLAAVIIGLSVWQAPGASTVAPRPPAGAETWSASQVVSYRVRGHPVFVYFTADWCLTCKANEAAVIDRSDVRSAFRDAEVRVLVADWTNGDPAITRFLESRGRAGVPLYLWYEPGGVAEELPQVLTTGMLISRARRQR